MGEPRPDSVPERLERLQKVFAKQIDDGYLAEALAELERLREALERAELACVRLGVAEVKDGSVRLKNNEEIAELAQALVQLRAALSPDQGTRAGTSGPPKSADTCPTCGSDDPAIDPSGAEYAPCDDPFHDRSGSEIPPMARCPQCGAVKLSEQECPRCAGTGASLAESDTCPSCGSDDPNTRLVAPRGGDEGSTRYYCIDPFHGCTCEPTGECMHSMSGPTCFIPGCPPCQHPELDTDPRCPVHGESVTAEQEAGE